MTSPLAKAIAERLARLNLRVPRLDLITAERALRDHLGPLGYRHLPVCWVDSGTQAYRYVFQEANRGRDAKFAREYLQRAGVEDFPYQRPVKRFMRPVSRSGTYRALRAAALAAWTRTVGAYDTSATSGSRFEREKARLTADWRRGQIQLAAHAAAYCIVGFDGLAHPDQVVSQPLSKSLQGFCRSEFSERQFSKLARVWEPLVDAAEAGLFLFRVTPGMVYCTAQPTIFAESGYLHRANGAAIEYFSGERYWFWYGVEMPDWAIRNPCEIKAAHVRDAKDAALQGALVRAMGAEHALAELDRTIVDSDVTHGTLWHCSLAWREDVICAVLEVENATSTAGGLRHKHFLFVPLRVRTARDAVAWTYGLAEEDYDLAVRT